MHYSITVLYVSEYTIVRLGLADYLTKHPSVNAAIEAESVEQAVSLLDEDGIDVLIVDLALLKASGLADIRLLLKKDPGVKIIVLSRNEREPFITQSIENGALGYISQRCSRDELIDAVKTVYHNERYLSHDVAYSYAMTTLNKGDNPISLLTSREYQVFTLLAKGTSVTDIASLFISPKTVHVYRTNLFSKLKLASTFELTLLALRHGVISMDLIEP